MKWHEGRTELARLRGLPDSDLSRLLNDTYRDRFNLRMRHANRQLENDRELADTRKQIARIKTVMRERSLLRAAQPGE
jgi:large subunit ribosomal protein L29